MRRSTGRASWTWKGWGEWHARAVERRHWRKKPIRRMLQLRDKTAAQRGDAINYYSASAVQEVHGMVYGIYHFPTGKWYVGQTINTVETRARQHWWSRNSAEDYFHLALADDPDPMCWVAFPLEAVPKEEWMTPESQRKAGWRKREVARFRVVATPREREWVNTLRTMWPKGWNSEYPGRPMRPHYAKAQGAAQSAESGQRQPARDIEAALDSIKKWESDPRAARQWLWGASREDLVEVLEGLQKGLRPAQQTPTTAAIALEVREVLRKRKAEKKQRDFIRFFYGNRIAGDMDLPSILRHPDVYKEHPEPDVGAAIMVVHKFAPQVATDLFNYKDWSMHPTPMENAPAATCPCHKQVLPGTSLVDGHVLCTDPAQLASPWLQDILAKGKKYRLQQSLSSVLPQLQNGLKEYQGYKQKKYPEDPAYHAQLEKWAAKVMAIATTRLTQAAQAQTPAPDGYPELRKQMQAAKNALVFGPEDRAPHALFFACGRMYQARLHERLEKAGAFSIVSSSRAEVLERIREQNEEFSLLHHGRLPYLYGAWKAKKEAFRWIAGTSKVQDEPDPSAQSNKRRKTEEGPPKNALSELGRVMTSLLQVVLSSLREKDVERRGRGFPARYWVVTDIDEFVQEFRVLAPQLSQVPWATYDFTTMYEALEHPTLITGVMHAAKEAWEYETTKVASATGKRPEEVELRLGTSGFRESREVADGPGSLWFSPDLLRRTLEFMLSNLYVENGGTLRKQERGVPMGLECSPQLANTYGYAVESIWVDEMRTPTNVLMRRYIDDIIIAGFDATKEGVGLPSQQQYGMGYKLTSASDSSLIYLGVRLFKDSSGAHSVLHDRAVDYPIRVDRYPSGSTVANPAQLGGVIMGRLVAAQRTCSRLDLFQNAVAGVFTHAYRRGYSRRLVHSVWTRFLARYWDAANVSSRELRAWFHRAWREIAGGEGDSSSSRKRQQRSGEPELERTPGGSEPIRMAPEEWHRLQMLADLCTPPSKADQMGQRATQREAPSPQPRESTFSSSSSSAITHDVPSTSALAKKSKDKGKGKEKARVSLHGNMDASSSSSPMSSQNGAQSVAPGGSSNPHAGVNGMEEGPRLAPPGRRSESPMLMDEAEGPEQRKDPPSAPMEGSARKPQETGVPMGFPIPMALTSPLSLSVTSAPTGVELRPEILERRIVVWSASNTMPGPLDGSIAPPPCNAQRLVMMEERHHIPPGYGQPFPLDYWTGPLRRLSSTRAASQGQDMLLWHPSMPHAQWEPLPMPLPEERLRITCRRPTLPAPLQSQPEREATPKGQTGGESMSQALQRPHPSAAPQRMEEDRDSQLGKRHAVEQLDPAAVEETAPGSQQSSLSRSNKKTRRATSAPAQQRGPMQSCKRESGTGWQKYGCLANWPEEERKHYDSFRKTKERAARFHFLDSLSEHVRWQIFHATDDAGRRDIREWQTLGQQEVTALAPEAESNEPHPASQSLVIVLKEEPSSEQQTTRVHDTQTSPRAPTIPQATATEESSHDWHEGARIGEASNPGPAPTEPKPQAAKQGSEAAKEKQTQQPTEKPEKSKELPKTKTDRTHPSREPRARRVTENMQRRQRSSAGLRRRRPHSRGLTGYQVPPTPRTTHQGKRPGSSVRGERHPTTMQTFPNSRPGSAQGKNPKQPAPNHTTPRGNPQAPNPNRQAASTTSAFMRDESGPSLREQLRQMAEEMRHLREGLQFLMSTNHGPPPSVGSPWMVPMQAWNPWRATTAMAANNEDYSIGFPPLSRSQLSRSERERERERSRERQFDP